MPELRRNTSAERKSGDAVRLAEVAGRQHGVVDVAQLHSCGVSEWAISRWLTAGRLHRIHPGVYALGHSSLPLFGRLFAALLYAAPDAALSHTTAAWLWGLVDAEPKRIHLTVPGRRLSMPDVRVHHSRRPQATTHRGLPVTTVARTLRDIAWMLPYAQLRRALAEADYRGLLVPREVERVLGRGRRGAAALRLALDAHLPDLAATLSVLEERFLALCETSQIPLPEVNATVQGLMVDALWRGERVIVELDGHAAHSRPFAVVRDRQRELALRAAGHLVLRYTWQQVVEEPEAVAGDLRRALAARSKAA